MEHLDCVNFVYEPRVFVNMLCPPALISISSNRVYSFLERNVAGPKSTQDRKIANACSTLTNANYLTNSFSMVSSNIKNSYVCNMQPYTVISAING